MATTTPNFGWSVPTSSDLVKNGATAIETLGDSIDASLVDLKGGTTGQVLAKATNTDMDFTWTTAGSTSGPTFRAYRATSQQSFSQNTWTKVQLNAESFDTANNFDSTTNYRFTPTTAGYYQFNSTLFISKTGQSLTSAQLYKNGVGNSRLYEWTNTAAYSQLNGSDIIYCNGSTDYIEVYVYDSDPSARNVEPSQISTFFSGVWIRS
jgi:hypothetical protein